METKKFMNCGEEFELLTSKLWKKILKTKEYKGVKYDRSFVITITDAMVEFAETYNDFICGIKKRQYSKQGPLWHPMLFYRLSQGWQRIALETTKCKNCDWIGMIANPTLPDLYFLLSNDIELMREASKLEQVRCPQCGGPLEREAIWVEAYEPKEIEK